MTIVERLNHEELFIDAIDETVELLQQAEVIIKTFVKEHPVWIDRKGQWQDPLGATAWLRTLKGEPPHG